MVRYDFTTLVDRAKTGSVKWGQMREANPGIPPGIPPFSVADLDLKHPPEIVTGLQEFMGDAILGYTGPTDAYFDAVMGWMERRHG